MANQGKPLTYGPPECRWIRGPKGLWHSRPWNGQEEIRAYIDANRIPLDIADRITEAKDKRVQL